MSERSASLMAIEWDIPMAKVGCSIEAEEHKETQTLCSNELAVMIVTLKIKNKQIIVNKELIR